MLHCISLPSFCIVLVTLQFPEGLLMFACTIADILERYGWLPSFCPQFSIHFLNSWHQRRASILAGWRFASNCETVKNPWSSQISLLDSFCTRKYQKQSSFSDYSFTFVPVAQQVLFLYMKVELIFFILNCYLLFRISFLYLKVIFH